MLGFGGATPCISKSKPLDGLEVSARREKTRTARRRGSFNIGLGWFETKENNLQYADADANTRVTLWTIEPSFWWQPVRSVEIGTSVGIWVFTGPVVRDFARVTLQPMILDAKPLAMLNDAFKLPKQPWHEFLAFRSSIIFVPRGYHAEQFGAIPGTFSVDRDILPSLMMFIDAEPLLRQWKDGK